LWLCCSILKTHLLLAGVDASHIYGGVEGTGDAGSVLVSSGGRFSAQDCWRVIAPYLTPSLTPAAGATAATGAGAVGFGSISSNYNNSNAAVQGIAGGQLTPVQSAQPSLHQNFPFTISASYPLLLLSYVDFIEVSDALAYLASRRPDAVLVFAPIFLIGTYVSSSISYFLLPQSIFCQQNDLL
jgi:hypothetical protein